MEDDKRYTRKRERFKVYTWKYKKTITPIASFVLLVNQIFGYGMDIIPSVVQENGWKRVFLVNLLTCIFISFSSLMLLKAITMIPNNSNFQQRIEYNTLVRYYLSDAGFKVISIVHYVGDFCTIIVGIITFSKLIDLMLIKLTGFTVILQLYPEFTVRRIGANLFMYIYETVDVEYKFGIFGVTLGYLICCLICVKLASSSLQETTKYHMVSFFVLLVSIGTFTVYNGAQSRFITKSRSKGKKSGNLVNIVLIFVENYNISSILPTWANEMRNDVNPTQIVWISCFFSFFVYLVFGINKAYAVTGSIFDDMINSNRNPLINTCIVLFVMLTIIPDVVFNCISVRYNLRNLGYKKHFFVSSVLPFLFSFLLLNNGLFQGFLSYINLFTLVICNYIIPITLYLISNEEQMMGKWENFERKRSVINRIMKTISLLSMNSSTSLLKSMSNMSLLKSMPKGSLLKSMSGSSLLKSLSNSSIGKSFASSSIASSISRSLSKSLSKSISKSLSKSLSKSISKSMSKSLSKSLSKSMSKNELKDEKKINYESFKIIRNSKDLYSINHDLFNAVNRPSRVIYTNEISHSFGSKGSEENLSSESKNNRWLLSERIVVFPKCISKYHLIISKSMLTSVVLIVILQPILFMKFNT